MGVVVTGMGSWRSRYQVAGLAAKIFRSLYDPVARWTPQTNEVVQGSNREKYTSLILNTIFSKQVVYIHVQKY